MEEQTDTICIKEETAVSDNEGDTVRVTSPAEDVVKKETFDERGEMILCDDGSIKEEFDEGEGEEMEIAAVMLPEFVDEAFGNEEGNFPDDVLRVKTTTSLRPGPKSKKRKMLQSESSQDPDWNPLAEGSKLQNALLRNRSDKKPNLGAAIPARRLPATETSGEEADSQAFPVPTSRRIAQTYRDTEISQPDNFLYCHECSVVYEGDCPEHGPLNIIEDVSVPADIADRSRASKTAPPQVVIGDSRIPGAGCGVRAKDVIPPRTRLGPYEGISVPIEECTSYSWLIRKDGEPSHCVDATELGLSNWLRFVNCARNELERNLIAFQYDGRVYYRTVCQVDPGEELLVWCGRAYSRQPDASDLVTAGNIKDTIYKCTACPFTCANIYYMERHKKTCRQNDGNQRIIFQCSHCPYACANTYFLERHRKHCTSQLSGNPADIAFKCSGCSYTCSNTYYLERHKKFCREVGKELKTAKKAQKAKMKKEAGTFACTDCNELFYDEETLSSHQMTHAGENPLVCRLCNERFFDLDTLTRHVQAHYGEGGALEAADEDRGNGLSGPNRAGYTKDVVPAEEKEEPEERFPCPLCGIQFFLKDSLTVHLRIHRGEKPYLCLECDVGFSREDYLRRHSRMHHEGKRFQCAECGKKYTELVYLKQHQRKHKTGP